MVHLITRILSEFLQETSPTVPKDFEARGVTDIPRFYFKDDAFASWDALHQVNTIKRSYSIVFNCQGLTTYIL